MKCRWSGLRGQGWWRILFPLSRKRRPTGECEPTQLSHLPLMNELQHTQKVRRPNHTHISQTLAKWVVKTCEVSFPPPPPSVFIFCSCFWAPCAAWPSGPGLQGQGCGRAGQSPEPYRVGRRVDIRLKCSNERCAFPRVMSGHLFCSNCSKNK